MSEKAMAPHSSTPAWKIPWMEEPARLQSMGSLESDTTKQLHFYFSLSCIGEGNGNPLQCSCLENPRDEGAWWAAIYGVAQSRTRLKWLSSSSFVSHIPPPCPTFKSRVEHLRNYKAMILETNGSKTVLRPRLWLCWSLRGPKQIGEPVPVSWSHISP